MVSPPTCELNCTGKETWAKNVFPDVFPIARRRTDVADFYSLITDEPGAVK